MKRKIVLAAGIVSVLGLAAAGVAFATPASGASGTPLLRGEAFEKVKTRGDQPYDVVVQSLTILPGGHTGWHTHPGIAVALVTAGALTVYDGDDASCSPQVYEAGQVYVDHGYGHVHIARNEGGVPTEIEVTYLDVDPGGPVRIDIPLAPGNCAF